MAQPATEKQLQPPDLPTPALPALPRLQPGSQHSGSNGPACPPLPPTSSPQEPVLFTSEALPGGSTADKYLMTWSAQQVNTRSAFGVSGTGEGGVGSE